ncbi:PTS ascorbate transporter subunit IIC [Streptococcus danieliae]|uniref:Ascorbate-specific PTS system EIIC component n=1 Tax=Streptococcus danieliae TaxID=747656 RepID=A0A7Z0RR63_9STRE|nr:PTS ascorbate transporter subunit IIC [Streptococcus danieliae]MBF0700226.1 PTS ascorbate transporter subunit IIC [Streptococcus danieliae]MBF0717755.1 PTS ascorbate transporter subunit IIC [Streptococcus danieliae]MVX58801.1 PTS ascorbate transporter subunit IIC [Streptococcus danieliae]NYS49685.1 PTS ascorbate transporter subunit IIC [Streptococcus danieliae]NYS97402.1 PTS ascorbate transporter subunit IIC [Streptococcus danieliae]
MNIIINILNWFSQNILQNPAFFVGLLVLVGYALLKKPGHEVFAGFVKATVGYMILNVGAGGLVTTFRPILAALNYKFQIGAAVIDPYFGLTAANTKIAEDFPDFVGAATTALLIGFGVNILLVALRKLTKVRTLFITGHIMVQQAATISLIVLLLVPQLRNSWGILAIGVICGLYWAVSSNMTVEATQRLTGGGGFAIGHQQQFAIWFVDKVAPFFGKKEENLDNLKLPKFLSIFHDTVVASATLMLVFFGAILMVLGPEIMSNAEVITSGTLYVAEKQSYFMYIIQTAFTFSVYLFILMQGVRMFVSELTNAFQGISSKLLPGSFPAVDVAASYGFGSPNAVLSGFAFGLLGQLVTIVLLIVFKNPVLIITGFVPVFFDNAAIAVYADKRGGWKAALSLSFISGILQVALGAVAVSLLGLASYGGYHGNIDFDIPWLPFAYLFKYLGIIGFALVCLFFLIIPQLQFAKAKDKEAYYAGQIPSEE